MNTRDWEKFGEDILKTVQNAVESCDYDKLNQTVGDAVNQVVDGVTRNVKNMKYSATQKRQTRVIVPMKKPSKLSGILFALFGYSLSVILALLLFAILIFSFVTGMFSGKLFPLLFTIMIPLAGGIVAGSIGISRLNRIERFKKYVKEIGNAEMCNIANLSGSVRKTNDFVIKDVEKMIKAGWFVQGHFDYQKTCLILTDNMYEQYRLLEQRKEAYQKEVLAEKEEQRAQDAYRKTLSPEVQNVIEQGEAYVRKIRECNDVIPGEEISAKIYRMEMLVDKIFDRVEQEPQTISDIRKLMDYYLPTTVKLLEAYAEMDAQPVGGKNIQNAKKEIEATLDTLNSAYEKLLDSLFQDKAWDVSSDISVLNTMLAQEGLKSDGLT